MQQTKRSAKSSAQRLSASQRWAYVELFRSALHLQAVLNAFRHHRGGHPNHLSNAVKT